jgi:hypothetical protein
MEINVLPGLRVEQTTSRGNGLFTTREFKRGDLIFHDTPIACQLKKFHNSLRVCNHCLRYVGSLSSQLQQMSLGLRLPHTLRVHEPFAPAAPAEVPCARGCGTLFCSTQCADAANRSYHQFLCFKSAAAEKDPQVANLINHLSSIDQRFDGAFLLTMGSRVFCNLVASAAEQKTDLQTALNASFPGHYMPLLSGFLDSKVNEKSEGEKKEAGKPSEKSSTEGGNERGNPNSANTAAADAKIHRTGDFGERTGEKSNPASKSDSVMQAVEVI